MSTKTKLVTLFAMAISIVSILPLKAWAEGPIMKREENQQDRIAQGIKSGSLTSKEATGLEKGETRLEKNREKALSDGKLSRSEKKRLENEANRESERIRKLKHNGKK